MKRERLSFLNDKRANKDTTTNEKKMNAVVTGLLQLRWQRRHQHLSRQYIDNDKGKHIYRTEIAMQSSEFYAVRMHGKNTLFRFHRISNVVQ